MTRDEVGAELDRRFADHMAAEEVRMRAEGIGSRIINAVIAENRQRFVEYREGAIEQVLTGPANDNLASMTPMGAA